MKKGKKQSKKHESAIKEEDLDRFAGSSDEDEEVEEEEELPVKESVESDTDGDNNDDENEEDDDESNRGKGIPSGDEYIKGDDERHVPDNDDDDDDDSSSVEEEINPAAKMANAMGRILGSRTVEREVSRKMKDAKTASSVVLAKTVTPLQKLQQQEKQQQVALKEKRQAKRERNLSALHYPLSIATTNNIQTGSRPSVAKELEQERLHRRVATRGVVALFNAISQHQRANVEVS